MSKSKNSQIINNWTKPELWVWEEISRGGVANFHTRYNKELDPKETHGWEDKLNDRLLSQEFMETLLNKKKILNGNIKIRIIGAYFKDTLNLEDIRLKQQLWLKNCRFLGSLNLKNLKIDGQVSLRGSYIKQNLNLKGAVIGGHMNLSKMAINGEIFLFNSTILGTESIIGDKRDIHSNITQSLEVNRKANVSEVALSASKIGGDLNMNGSVFKSTLNMHSMKVEGDLLMTKKANFEKIILVNSAIHGHIDMCTSIFKKDLVMYGMDVGRDLFMCEVKEFHAVDLSGSKIGGQFDIMNAKFKDKLDLSGVEIKEALVLRDSFFQEVDLSSAKVNSKLEVSNCEFHQKLNMYGISIGKTFQVSECSFEDIFLDLSYSTLGAVDLHNSMIYNLDLTFTRILTYFYFNIAKSGNKDDKDYPYLIL